MTSNKKTKTNHLTQDETIVINSSTNILIKWGVLYHGIISRKES